ncbi:aldo/keto reductase family oxidoreductase [Sphingomonas sp. LaA6.9]|uniref:aldo/keto reductase n=1 Tax=Sphingomonas sp. LaA6.9 TaxID=2919914 RepID=UPI001F4FD51C|nr:aldo/keto reductase [Sphingomonas sp. LaA6.9]MCJ8159175.1 aldo/keto reductase [Sphingomonas sp. LaA6.9]
MSDLAFSPESRPLGKSGLTVSPLAWGMWRFRGDDVAAARKRVEAALDAGITLFDTADVYGPDNGEPFGAAEVLLGRVFAEAPELREQMTLATKGGIVIGTPYDSSAPYIEAAIDASLRRLGVEQIDLWQIHRPDILTHPHEIARAFETAHEKGKVRVFGVSNYTPSQAAMLQHFMDRPLVSHQPEFSPLTLAPLTNGLMDQAIANDMAVLAWSPLGGGRIAAPLTQAEHAVAMLLDAKAQDYGVSRTAAAYSWIMAHPARPIPIVGSQQPERIREAAGALTPRWTRAEWYAVLQASMGESLP